MAKSKFNHRKSYEGIQPAKVAALYPGMIVEFTYTGEDIFDKKPLILLLYREYNEMGRGDLVHGLNLNYISPDMVQNLFCTCELLYKGAGVYSKEPIRRSVQSQMDDYDDTHSNRNLLRENFTRIMLPTYKENRGGNPLSKSEAKREMKVLYEKVIKKILSKHNIYRTYKQKKMNSLNVIQFKLGDWNQPRLQ
mgnify:CR=1 FL=1